MVFYVHRVSLLFTRQRFFTTFVIKECMGASDAYVIELVQE